MSIYYGLLKGPTRSNYTRRVRCEIINRQLRMAKEERKAEKETVYIYNKRKRNKRRPDKRDLEFEKHRMDKDEKKKIEELEKDTDDEDEKLVLEDKDADELKTEILMVQDQDMHVKENGVEHNTDEYFCVENDEDPQMVVRRGQEFKLTLTFQRPWDGKIDDMYLIFKIGQKPRWNKGTYAKVKLEEGNDTSYMTGPNRKWGARIINVDGNKMTISVYSPPTTIIGEWEYAIRTIKEKTGDEKKKKRYQCLGEDDIIILLNPWCKDDQVYLESEKEKKEYIENESGMVFFGSSDSLNAKPWTYGQFEPLILEISLHLLRKAFDYCITKKMSNPVLIARALSRIMNSNDNEGVLIGNWSGNYQGGTAPLVWKGSEPILEKYYQTKEPVKYGQCWVFSHVLTTVARALGLPCRSVTNFSSAHDTNESLTIDKFIDIEGDILPGRDSVWNFHVWNEVWMHRPDLDIHYKANGKYDGWHVIDATPQETSDSLFQCGPSPLEAIRQGDMHIGYDTKFIFAEVNADICHWQDVGDEQVLIRQESSSVGRKISTKIDNGDEMTDTFWGFDEGDRMDVTNLYKHPEGSVAEREVMEKALGDGFLAKALFHNPTGINMEVLEVPPPKLGEDFKISIKAHNNASEKRSVRVFVNVRPMTYWGDVIGTKKIASNTFSEVLLEPDESKTFEMEIKSERCMEECDDQLSMTVLAMGMVRGFDDHENSVHTTRNIQVQVPKISIKGPGGGRIPGEPFTIELEFTNPLARTLKGCCLTVEGSVELMDKGFDSEYRVSKKKIDDIKANETRKMTLTIKPNVRPKRSLMRKVTVGIECDIPNEIEGTLHIRLQR